MSKAKPEVKEKAKIKEKAEVREKKKRGPRESAQDFLIDMLCRDPSNDESRVVGALKKKSLLKKKLIDLLQRSLLVCRDAAASNRMSAWLSLVQSATNNSGRLAGLTAGSTRKYKIQDPSGNRPFVLIPVGLYGQKGDELVVTFLKGSALINKAADYTSGDKATNVTNEAVNAF